MKDALKISEVPKNAEMQVAMIGANFAG